MEKNFDDIFMDIQIEMLRAARNGLFCDVDKIYIYAACENNHMSAAYFYESNGVVYDTSEVAAMAEEQGKKKQFEKCRDKIFSLVIELSKVCEKYDRPMPTEIKLICDLNTHTADSQYKYEPVFTPLDTIPYTIYSQWVEELKNSKK